MTKRKSLGKGLSALIPDADQMDDTSAHLFHCPIDAIQPNPYQPRQDFSPSDLEDMAKSVKEKGVLTPLLVSKTSSGYQLIAGERRWKAAQMAGLSRVPVVLRDASPAEYLELALIENIHRKDLNPIEEAMAYQRLLDETQSTHETLAKTLGRDRTTITNSLRLLNLPPFIQKDVIDGRLTMGHARVLAGVKDPQIQRTLKDYALKNNPSVRQLEALAKKRQGAPPSRPKTSETHHYYRSVEDNLKHALGTKVDIRKRGKQGRIVIHFFSEEELDRLLHILT